MARRIDRIKERVARKIRVPKDLEAITDIGEEKPCEGVEAIWASAVEFYKTGMHPAVQMSITYKGEVVLDRAIGHAKGVVPAQKIPDDAVPLRTTTPINLFSGAKGVTSIVMHKLESDGVLSLDEPVASYLPGFEKHGKQDITLKQILNHRAGIAKIPAEAMDLDLLSDPEAIEELICDLVPEPSHIGSANYHAVSGGFVMDAVVRHVTGKDLRYFLREDFKKPLGLGWFDFGVEPEYVNQVADNVITGFPLGPLLSRMMTRLLGVSWESVVEMSNDPRFVSGILPSANVIATARDAALFYQCLMNGGELHGVRVMDENAVSELIHDPEARIELDGLIGMPMRYGNGFMMGSDTISLYGWNHPRAFGHVGMSNSFTWANPERSLSVALLTTGKPIMGTHLGALPTMFKAVHKAFPSTQKSKRFSLLRTR